MEISRHDFIVFDIFSSPSLVHEDTALRRP